MEQPETPQEPAPASDPVAVPKELPDPKGALPIPDHFRLPFHGKMVTPTAVPSATERRRNLSLLQKRKRRRGFLTGLLAGQLLIMAMDFGGTWFLRSHPHVKLQAPVGVQAVVFLGMAIGGGVMIAALSAIFAVLGLRALFGPRRVGLGTATGRGIARVLQTTLVLGLSMAVILGTAWFMIPGDEWTRTGAFAKEQGRKVMAAAQSRLKSMVRTGAGQP
ncbi:MAG TPA: hypothetical protein VG457_06120 [Planctomycetota bacterium]|jgi:hypothetical protein|nr:hypothetical protein [Planctomycetota bacterium]